MSVGKLDVECFLDDVKTAMVAGLNAAIASVNSDKNDSVVLADVDPSNGYVFQAPLGPVNADPWVLYGIELPVAESKGPNTAIEYTLFAVIVVSDPGNDDDIFRRMLRYQRAMIDFFRESWATMSRARIRPTISGLNPFPISFKGIDRNSMAAGVSLKITTG